MYVDGDVNQTDGIQLPIAGLRFAQNDFVGVTLGGC